MSTSRAKTTNVDDISLRHFIGIIASEMKQLVELKLDSWEFSLNSLDQDLSAKLQSIKKLKRIQLERVNESIPELCVKGNNNNSWCCTKTLLHHLVSYVTNLEEISLCYYRVNNCSFDLNMAAGISKCLHNHWNHTPFTVKFFNLSPDVENTIHQILKKPPHRVKKINGPSLTRTFEVRNVLSLIRRH